MFPGEDKPTKVRTILLLGHLNTVIQVHKKLKQLPAY